VPVTVWISFGDKILNVIMVQCAHFINNTFTILFLILKQFYCSWTRFCYFFLSCEGLVIDVPSLSSKPALTGTTCHKWLVFFNNLLYKVSTAVEDNFIGKKHFTPNSGYQQTKTWEILQCEKPVSFFLTADVVMSSNQWQT